jgi:hypothetical protein
MEFVNNKEHEAIGANPSLSGGGGVHKNGSGVAYISSSAATNRPDGSTALAVNNTDKGRLWLDDTTTPPVLKRWDGSAWVQASAVVPKDGSVQAVDQAGTGLVPLIGANASDKPELPDGAVATTQTAGDNSTKVATTAYANQAGSINLSQNSTTATIAGTSSNAHTSPFVITDGDEVVTVTITGLTIGNVVEVKGRLVGTTDNGSAVQGALFVDSVSSSLDVAANDSDNVVAGNSSILLLAYFTATAASHTFRMRISSESGTYTANNAYGGTATSWISAMEIK